MQKVQVIQRFICRITQRPYEVGEVLHVSEERAAELKAKGKVQFKSDPVILDEKVHVEPAKKKKIIKK